MRLARISASIILCAAVVLLCIQRAQTAKPVTDRARKHLIEQARRSRPNPGLHRRHLDTPRRHRPVDKPATIPAFPKSLTSMSPPSPGLAVATTWLDMQHTHSLGKQIIHYPWHDYVYITWSAFPNFDPDESWDEPEARLVIYRPSTGALTPGFGGVMISLDPISHGQYTNVDAYDVGNAIASYHQREDLSWPKVPFVMYGSNPGAQWFTDEGLYPQPPCAEALWPKLSTQHRAGEWDLIQVTALAGPTCGTQHLYYARFGDGVWSTLKVIDSTSSRGYIIVADQNSDKTAIIMHDDSEPTFNGANNIVYYESLTTGLGWINGQELGPGYRTVITSYSDTVSGPQAWRHIDAAYDNSGVLHVIWDEQAIANKSASVTVRHWNNADFTIRPVVSGNWTPPPGQSRLNITNLSLGVGDGSTPCSISGPGGTNLDYLYVLYTKLGGPNSAEYGDTSAGGYPNGELCMTISTDGGTSWSPSVNLTNTQSPDCDPATPGNECRSEDWGTISKVVSDIDIAYISDHDAGAALLGEGTYQPNDVMYLRIEGGTADVIPLCPPPGGSAGFSAFLTSDPVCVYHAEPGAVKSDETLTLTNSGTGELVGEISVLPGAPWLSVMGMGSYSIPSGGTDLVFTVTMDASLLPEGHYNGTIRVTHNDPSQISPIDFPVGFFVITGYQCADHVVLTTGVQSGGLR